ncbi:DNA polymerase III subunit epsilon [Legionella geestiana]|uniref:DNA polymerase III subunit epsilon n=1 Tax=Legionella geestiana TaxID=45065 RepID=A0A0W0TYK0_9GAMM|nr:DNA polymerase III subunit epsilon [Legionella geestiana]KTD00704.1 DNA polymerase III subunit epsilon [Legionella geestiana]QBS11565.1 DNA polymerase III subunit epsilon [Legionella geestiana]QDQ40827.1 DNA polymerase III subunit epsilon [Legionella geestiana]STX53761.1 DNA polymerase III subunit epsilon [Legionella geestiana]
MRQVVLDTETTGIGHESGHRIIEIGCVELVSRKITGRHYHVYLNPEREVDEGAFRVHGISTEFLRDKPRFAEEVEAFLAFVEGAELVIHNAAFDVGFLNAELKRLKRKQRIEDYCTVLDTLMIARDKHPGQRNSLDALCKRYDIDNSNRTFHGALLDAEILAHVYLAMTGGQTSILFDKVEERSAVVTAEAFERPLSVNIPVIAASEEEMFQHEQFLAFLIKKSGKEGILDDWK